MSVGIAFLAFLFIYSSNKNPMTISQNPKLKTYKPNSNWAGNPTDEKGRYQNIYHPFIAQFSDVLKWMWSKNPQAKAKKNEKRKLPNAFQPNVFNTQADYAIWLGHASYIFQINGKRYITDPVFYNPWFLKRESDFPFDLKYLPTVDYLLLSHNHRDHCDKKSIQFLSEHNPNMKILTGLGMQSVIASWCKNQIIEEAGWYQAFASGEPDVEIVFTPARHWSKRGLNDDNTSLWGGFYIKPQNKKSIYFMGDSGYSPVFKDIQSTLGSPDYCIMGVGAYLPEWFMHQAHMSPLDAIKVFNEMGGKYFIPMHYGTFDLSDEPRMQPWEVLEENKHTIRGQLLEGVLGQNLLQD